MVVVEDTELFAETDDAACAARSEFGFEFVEEIVGGLGALLARGGAFDLFVQNFTSEFFIVDCTGLIIIV